MNTKTKKRVPPGTPRYHRLTGENRITIQALKKEGFGDAEIARHIGFSPSTICSELNRNKSMKGYRPKKAQGMADERLRKKAASRRKMTDAMWADAKGKVSDGWTFERIS